MILPVQILIQKPKAIAMSHLILIWMQEDIFKPPQSVFLGGMTKGTLCNDNAMSIHFDFLPFLYLINKYNHELEISRFFSQSRDFSKCNSRFRLLRGWQVCMLLVTWVHKFVSDPLECRARTADLSTHTIWSCDTRS